MHPHPACNRPAIIYPLTHLSEFTSRHEKYGLIDGEILKRIMGSIMRAPAVSSDIVPSSAALAKKFQPIDEALKKCRYQQDALIEVLHTAQQTYGYLDEELLDYLALQLRLPPSLVYGVATFYNFFTLEPHAKHVCVVCLGTACYIKNAAAILSRIKEVFDLNPGGATPDGQLSLLTTRCFGSCSLAPMLTVDNDVSINLTPEEAIAAIRAKLASSVTRTAQERP